MVAQEVRVIITKYINVLSSKGIRVERAVLFGSQISGNIHAFSDIDIAIVSPDFGKDRFEEGKMLFQAAWRVDPRIEPVPISSESYKNDTWVPLIYEIREKGVELQVA